MHYLALYRKYRPNSFEEVVGQENTINVIKNEVLNNKVSHAYLFSGPRGTGKTTTAKIIAKLVNCLNVRDGEACEECENCLNFKNSSDIVEIDAASNNGVDEIRELRDKVNLVPTSSKYKVYIIDEVHMLTTQAFNALLKTLEEPPAHAIFILATTEPYKIPITVASRCQKFQFSKITDEELVKRLKFISSNENLNISDEVLYEIARLSDGGARDAINMLDQLIAYKGVDITIDDVYNINGTVSYIDLYYFLKNIKNNNIVEIVNFVEKVDNEGKNISKFINELMIFLKDILLYKNANINGEIGDRNEKIKELSTIFEEKTLYNMIYSYNELINNIKLSNNSVILFVVCTLKLVKEHFSVCSTNKINDFVKEEDKSPEKINDIEDNISFEKVSSEIVNTRINNTFAIANKNELIELKQNWNKINDYLLDGKNAVNCGVLKETEVVAAGGKYLILSSKFESVVDKINNKLSDFEDTLYHVFNKKYNIIALSFNDWENEKSKYIENIKKGIKYQMINEESFVKEKERTPIDDLIDVIGEEYIEIE